jgi:hypothetical protein
VAFLPTLPSAAMFARRTPRLAILVALISDAVSVCSVIDVANVRDEPGPESQCP